MKFSKIYIDQYTLLLTAGNNSNYLRKEKLKARKFQKSKNKNKIVILLQLKNKFAVLKKKLRVFLQLFKKKINFKRQKF